MLNAQIMKDRTLIDAKEHLTGIDRIVAAGIVIERRLAPLQPAVSPVAGIFHIVIGRRNLDALVKRHRDIRTEVRLNAHTLLRPHKDMPPVNVAVEGDTLLRDLTKLRQRKDLKSAAIRQDRFIPRHEFMQTAEVADQLISGSHVQMVRVGQLDLTADALKILRRERALDSRLRADIHKHRRLNRTVQRREFAPARMTVLANQLIHSLLAFLL